jgi:hypothetical protein
VELWELAAREAIRETVAAYAHYADSGRFEELAALFAPDGVLEIHLGKEVRGRDNIVAFLGSVGRELEATSSTRLIRHFVANVRIDVASRTAATGASYFVALTDHGVDHWGRYRDTYVPGEGDTWLFAHRLARVDGRL